MKFLKYLKEEMKKEDIEYWSNYSINMNFKSSDEAKKWIKNKLDIWYKQGLIFGDPDYSIVDEMPIYKKGKYYKIGKPLKKKKLTWDDIEVEEAKIYHIIGTTVNPMDIKKTIKTKFYPISKIHGTEKIYTDRVNKIILEIKEENIFYPIVIDNNYAILDGHHRFEAIKKLKLKKIPALMIVLKDY